MRFSASCQPVGHTMEIGGETLKPAHGLRVPIRPDRHVGRAVPHIDPGGVGVQDFDCRRT
jgi:hypothetical protein